jgi:O-antigen/teichoic acid export membrane protein
MLIGSSILLVYFLKSVSIYQILNLYGFLQFVILVVQIVLCKKYLPKETFTSERSPREKTWRRVALQLMITYLIWRIMFRTQLFTLEAIGPNEASVGFFAATLTITAFYETMTNAFAYALTPYISPAVATNNQKQLQYILNIGNLLLYIIAPLLLFCLLIFRTEILGFFGKQFVQATWILVIVGIGAAISGIFALPWYFLNMAGCQKEVMIFNTILVITNVVLSILLVYFFDVYGAAISYTLIQLIFAVGTTFMMKKKLKLKPFFIV